MPRGQPFTRMCQVLAGLNRQIVADLHAHTFASDGDLSPSQLFQLAKNAQLKAMAITDHDTVAGAILAEAECSTFPSLNFVPGIEISTEYQAREWHLLGLFIDPHHSIWSEVLPPILEGRRVRFQDYLDAIHAAGVTLDAGLLHTIQSRTTALGRLHVAKLLVQSGVVRNRQEAFQTAMPEYEITVRPKVLLPIAEACDAIHTAGGFAVLAHPSIDVDQAFLQDLQSRGLDGVEVCHPSLNLSRSLQLRQWASELGLKISGGSDYHGGSLVQRSVGSTGLIRQDWQQWNQSGQLLVS